MFCYPAKYTDADGSESTTISNDGETLRMTVRGLACSGTDFDSLAVPPDATHEQRKRVPLHRDCLCSCRIEFQIPILMHDHGRPSHGTLLAELVLGDPAPHGGLDREALSITLDYNGRRFAGTGNAGWFEDELIDIQKKLPDGVFMQSCINCQFSDYSPAGHGLFGYMLCFRNIKAEYMGVKTKEDFWSVHDRYERMVQETYLCPEFERRIAGTGYRG